MMRLPIQTRFNSNGIMNIFLICLVRFVIGASASELVFSEHQFGDLRLSYQPPRNDGGEPITKYKVEWDASQNNNLLPSFTPSSQFFGSAEVTYVREEQEIVLSCQSICSGTFALSWGGRMSAPLNIDSTSEDLEAVINELVDPQNAVHSPVRVTRSANGFGYKWKVVFWGINGDVGLIYADGDLLAGGAAIRVMELTPGSSDIYPGAYTNEIQTVSVRKQRGFGCESLDGAFSLDFEGKVTGSISVDASVEDFKAALELLETIHTVNVESGHHVSGGSGDCASRSWIVTFTHLVHENRRGAGDLGFLRLSSSSFNDPTVTHVEVFENIRGTNPRSFNIRGVQYGLVYHCRVSAYNAIGYGVLSSTVAATPVIQPPPPNNAILSIPDPDTFDEPGTSLMLSWDAVETDINSNGGDPVSEYKVEWYSSIDEREIQKLTTSSSDGITEIQKIKISADEDGITGYFSIVFDGESTELIPHDVDADGEGSLEVKLERLSTIGDVEVTRDLSWVSIPHVRFNLLHGSNVLELVDNESNPDLVEIFSDGDPIKVGGEHHVISSIAGSSVTLSDTYNGPSASNIIIHKWSYGYEWLVTFNSNIGEQSLFEVHPADNWAGTNPVIEVTRVRKGLKPLSGMMRLGFEGERTLPIPFDADALLMKQALESLSAIGEVDVTRYANNNGHNYFITFLSELGDLDQITVDDSNLMGPDARARVATIVDGTEPSDFGEAIIPHSNVGSSSFKYHIKGLKNGLPYYVRIRSRNAKGLGYSTLAISSPVTPVGPPLPPSTSDAFPLSDSLIRVVWDSADQTGGAPIEKYALQWDTDPSFPNEWVDSYFREILVDTQDVAGTRYCDDFPVPISSASMTQYARILSFNGYKWSDPDRSDVLSVTAAIGKPGPVKNFDVFPTSNLGMMMTWIPPSVNSNDKSCDYAGDGGSTITQYIIEYDSKADFASPATSVIVPSTDTSLRIGGRDVLSGSEASTLQVGGTYYARITAFNAEGSGSTVIFPAAVGPLVDTAPGIPSILRAVPVSASSVKVEWETPSLDGGSVLQDYIVEYDTEASFDVTPKNISVPVVSEVKGLELGLSSVNLNIHTIQATVAITNEVQLIKTEIDGVDEVQEVSTTCDDVVAEVQMVVTNAVDTNEEQVVSLMSDDVDEIQLVRTASNDQVEVQSVEVSVQRVNEVQRLGIIVSNINTDGDGIHSTACMGNDVGDQCSDIEAALSGSFTVSFDFDECGGNGVNYCQLALSEYDPDLGTVVCSPGLVLDPFSGGDHCVSEPVSSYSSTSVEGEPGTLQQVINDLIDDNGVAFMTLSDSSLQGKKEGVTVTREGRIKTKGSCTLDPLGVDPAVCSGEYELVYEITFDAVHSSGDVPPITVVASDFSVDTSSSSYTNTLCPSYYVNGCEVPTGAALSSEYGSFFDSDAGSVAFEAIKGSQPNGMITLDYECESRVVRLPGSFSMSVYNNGMSASFDSEDYVQYMSLGQWLRFSNGDGIDFYREIAEIDIGTNSVQLATRAPTDGVSYQDVEFGDYFSDWEGNNGDSGVSSYCMASRIQSTLPLDVDVNNEANSVVDWKGKIGALPIIVSSGVSVSRNVISDLMSDVGLRWEITFQNQPGHVHQMVCKTISGTNDCSVDTIQDSSLIDGSFTLQTTWPHEYVSETIEVYETTFMSWNIEPHNLKFALESISDSDGNKVFGLVSVDRSPYVPPTHSRWSGGYQWAITFLSRGGNVPAMTFDDSSLIGLDVSLEISDQDSGASDLFQGIRNSAAFSSNDPNLARDGNQISGSFSLFWGGNNYHPSIETGELFPVQTGGSSTDQYTALSAEGFKSLFEEYILGESNDQIDVIRSEVPTQWMGFTYTLVFRHEDVGGDVPLLVHKLGSSLQGQNSHVHIAESIKGTEITGTFQLRFEGETTRPINYDATALDVQEALNELNSIAPSSVVVSGGNDPVRSGPSDGKVGTSTQVGGRIWYVSFASNTWADPTLIHDASFVPGNWVGPPASYSDTWNSGFSKAWGKNVGNVPMMSCLSSGLTTTNGALPEDGCSVHEVVPGTNPLGGVFKLCMDSLTNPNGVMSVESDVCTEFIHHNAVASADESGGDGTSVEEKLEQLENIGDVDVTRSDVNPRNGGYTWKITFLHDVDGLCEQKDDIHSLCNSPGNVPKLCSGSTACDTSSLLGTCLNPNMCQKLDVLDIEGRDSGQRFPGGNEKQAIFVKDVDYLGWKDGSAVSTEEVKEFRLIVGDEETSCIQNNASAEDMRVAIQVALNNGIGGSVRVDRIQSEDIAPNGFAYYLTFYDTEDLDLIETSLSTSCTQDFEPSQSVEVLPMVDGSLHPFNCNDCASGIVQRGEITTLEIEGDNLSGALDWNADPASVKAHLEQQLGRTVVTSRSILDKYGTVEWTITFTENVDSTPSGAGDVPDLIVSQGPDTAGRSANIQINEITKGSEGLSGTFDLDYASFDGSRSFSYDESAIRMMRKLEEMSTVGKVFISKDCYPSCSTGGWGGSAVAPGTLGGYKWVVHFLKNPGSDNGVTFPPGSGFMNSPTIDDTLLLGDDALVSISSSLDGSLPLLGKFHLTINDEETASIPYNADASTLEQTINDLQSVGDVTVESGLLANDIISGIHATVTTDSNVASIVGGDLREHLAPGDLFRIGGSTSEFDGAELVGSASLTPSSPVLTGVQLNALRNVIYRGEKVRVGGETYTIVKNGVEVQLIAVHRSEDIPDGNFYQLRVSIDSLTDVTSCLMFDASALDVETALNELPILSNNGGVLVTRTNDTTGFIGDAHLYRVHFIGSGLIGDIDEMVAEECSSGIVAGADSSNSHIHIRTMMHGGKTEHQRISLSSDFGNTSDSPAFRFSILDSSSKSWTSPCIQWGVPSLDLSSTMDMDVFASAPLSVGSGVTQVGDAIYMIEASNYVEGIILPGDFVNPGSKCPGNVISIAKDGKSFLVESNSECTSVSGDELLVGSDVSIIESSMSHSRSISEVVILEMYSNEEILSSAGLYRLTVDHEGVSKRTECLPIGASAEDIQNQIGQLFDFNLDGVIDSFDSDHISVSQLFYDDVSSSSYGYSYKIISGGSISTFGPSAVLGSNAPKFSVVDIGADGGCEDYSMIDDLITNTASTTDESDTLSLGTVMANIVAGARIIISSSLVPSKIFTVDHILPDNQSIVLTETFYGSTMSGSATIHSISGGVPHFSVQVIQEGIDEHVYDLFFTGSHWGDVPQINVNTYGDGACSASHADIIDGMNRNIGVSTIVDGGGKVDSLAESYVIDRVARHDQKGMQNVHVVPPTLSVQDFSSEVQRIIVMDDGNESVWGSGMSSYKLSFGGEFTGCIKYDATEKQLEFELNTITSICPSASDSCVTVTRRQDAILAPNGFVYKIYFDSGVLANSDITDPGIEGGLEAHTSHPDCVAFDAVGGEQVAITTLLQGSLSQHFTSIQLPFGGGVDRWISESQSNVPIYRISGFYWLIRFGQSLGSTTQMSIDSSPLSSGAEYSVVQVQEGINPGDVAISNLPTGIPHYFRVYAKSSNTAISPHSDTIYAIPSGKPEVMSMVSSGYALHRNEVQKIVLAATHQNEVQIVTTTAISIPEVQEIILEGTEESDMNAYLFSLRHPEIQVIKLTAGSPVTSGSFFLKLRYIDWIDSNLSGALVYTEMKSSCIPFDATAEEFRNAIEVDALANPLGLDSIRVYRSGNRSFSSDYGHVYEIHFVGSNVRGNMLEVTSDMTLSGLDSMGGSSCDVFVSSTNDASIDIWTENESFSLGTDTPRVELAIVSNMQIVEGGFQLSITHLGTQTLTSCISWNARSSEVEHAIEALSNVDSVRVDDRDVGDGFVVYFDGNAMHTSGTDASDFMPLQGANFEVVDSNSCNPPKAYYNNALKEVIEIPGGMASIHVAAAYDGKHTLPGAPSSESSNAIRNALLTSLPMSIHQAQIAESLETRTNGLTFTVTYGNEDGNVPLLVCNHPETSTLVSCQTTTVMDANEIQGNFYLESSDAIPHDASSSQMEAAISKLPGVGRVDVTRSQADGQGGCTWNVTFTESDGDIPILRASNSLTGKGAMVSVSESTKGNQLGGTFALSLADETTSQLPFDLDAEALTAALEGMDGLGSVLVQKDGNVDSEFGRSFTITFLDANIGDVPTLTPNGANLTGLGAAISTIEHVKGSVASRSSLHISYKHPMSCSSSDVGRASCGSPIMEDIIELSASSTFDVMPTVLQHSPDYSIQRIRIVSTGTAPLQFLSGYFNIEYDGRRSKPINAHASADEVRFILEDLPGIDTVSVIRDVSEQPLPGVCIDVRIGSFTVECNPSCSPCNFAQLGMKANQLVKIGDKWQRVSSYYNGENEHFDMASIDDSKMKTLFAGDHDLIKWDLHVWTGGYEWAVSLLKVEGPMIKSFTTPKHHMLPQEAAIEIVPQDCDNCVHVSSLSPGVEYYIRAKSANERGWSDYSYPISDIPRGVPTAPQNVHLTAVSSICLEVAFGPPLYDYLVSSYVIQWDDNESFTNAESDSSSCSSVGYGMCSISQTSPPPYRHEFCGLVEARSYFVRVAARNSVPIQFLHHPSGVPTDNTQWSASVSAETSDQVPDPPTSLELIIFGRESFQLLFKWPTRDGGKPISSFVVLYDIEEDFSSSNTMEIAAAVPSVIPNSGDTYIFDFSPTTPRLVAGQRYYLKLLAMNNVGTGAESEIISGVPSGPSDPPRTGTLTTLGTSEFPITSAEIVWMAPSSNGGYPIDGYLVEWWTEETVPEVQIVRLQYSSLLFDTTFSLSFSPTPTIKKETPNLPWDASASLVRRELLNLGWDESDDLLLISDVEVTRTSIANGFQWMITFGNNPDRTTSDGDIVTLSGSVMTNGDSGSPSITVATLQDGQREGGFTEIQYLQVTGKGIVSGHYRLKFAGSKWSSFIPVHADAGYIKQVLEQLSTISEVDVIQNDDVDTTLIGTEGDTIHHYEIHFVSNPGDVEALIIDSAHVASTEDDVKVVVHDGSNLIDSMKNKASATTPGELPPSYQNSGLLDSSAESFRITGLQTGREYFVAVSATNSAHGPSKRLIPFPSSITPPLQAPESPQHVTLSVNTGYSDSLIVDFNSPASDGGSDILFYRVELDPTSSFDYPIVQDFHCPSNNRRTEWQIETSADSGVITGGSFQLEFEVDGFTSITKALHYDSVALASNETGISEELIPTFSTVANSDVLTTIPPTNIESVLFPGDRLRFSGQSMAYKYYYVQSVTGTTATLTEDFNGDDGIQISTTRYYGGRGNPLSSRIHCHFNEVLCPVISETKSGSLQSKLEDLSPAIQNGVYIDRDGPNAQNGFIWRVTFLDDAYPAERDFSLRLHSNSLTTSTGSGHVEVILLNSGKTYSSCTGPHVVPSLGGLVKGLHYYARVSARNKVGYSLPNKDENPVAPTVVPAAPTGVTLEVVSATGLRVMFGSPPDNGGDTITQYLIEWSTSSDFENTESSTHDYLAGGSPFFKNIDGLSTGVYYYVRVKAMNSQGYGVSQSSTPASLNPHQKPSPPTNVRLGVTSNSMLTIGWDPPLSDGGDSIVKYRVEWDTNPHFVSASNPPNKGYVDLGPSSRSFTVDLLSPAKSYYFRVYAINSAGSSQAQMSDPSWAFPRLQVPGTPHSLVCVSGEMTGIIEFAWQRPKIPHHGTPCFSEKDCPTPYGGSLPQTDGGDDILDYELEINERNDYAGSDTRMVTLSSIILYTNVDNLYPGRTYYARVLARNSVGNGSYSQSVSCTA